MPFGFQTLCDHIHRPTHEAAVLLHPEMIVTSELSAVRESGMVVFATPSFAIRETARMVREYLRDDVILVSVTKGIEAETGLRMTQIIEQETGRIAAALSGPSHAEEVSRNIPTGCVAACTDISVAEQVQDAFMRFITALMIRECSSLLRPRPPATSFPKTQPTVCVPPRRLKNSRAFTGEKAYDTKRIQQASRVGA